MVAKNATVRKASDLSDYANLIITGGRSGGQTVKGGTGSGENLTLSSTNHATKGKIYLGASSAYDEVNDRLGIGTASPSGALQVTRTSADAAIIANTFTSGNPYIQLTAAGQQDWSFGVDRSDSGKFKIASSTVITVATRMSITSGGNFGFGTDSPNAAALLDLTSTTKGLLLPRMTTTQRDAISSPPSGLVIYNTSTGKINVRGASAWEAVTSA